MGLRHGARASTIRPLRAAGPTREALHVHQRRHTIGPPALGRRVHRSKNVAAHLHPHLVLRQAHDRTCRSRPTVAPRKQFTHLASTDQLILSPHLHRHPSFTNLSLPHRHRPLPIISLPLVPADQEQRLGAQLRLCLRLARQRVRRAGVQVLPLVDLLLLLVRTLLLWQGLATVRMGSCIMGNLLLAILTRSKNILAPRSGSRTGAGR